MQVLQDERVPAKLMSIVVICRGLRKHRDCSGDAQRPVAKGLQGTILVQSSLKLRH